MVLTEAQNDELEDMLETILNNVDKLNDWEKGFVEDNYQRWQRFGVNILLSDKQWEIIHKLYQKVQQ